MTKGCVRCYIFGVNGVEEERFHVTGHREGPQLLKADLPAGVEETASELPG